LNVLAFLYARIFEQARQVRNSSLNTAVDYRTTLSFNMRCNVLQRRRGVYSAEMGGSKLPATQLCPGVKNPTQYVNTYCSALNFCGDHSIGKKMTHYITMHPDHLID